MRKLFNLSLSYESGPDLLDNTLSEASEAYRTPYEYGGFVFANLQRTEISSGDDELPLLNRGPHGAGPLSGCLLADLVLHVRMRNLSRSLAATST